jgi:hypothetical protein
MLKIIRSKEFKKLQWVQDPIEINGDNLNKESCEARIIIRDEKREYLKDKIHELNEFKRRYQPITNNEG